METYRALLYQTAPSPCGTLKAMCAGVGWVLVARQVTEAGWGPGYKASLHYLLTTDATVHKLYINSYGWGLYQYSIVYGSLHNAPYKPNISGVVGPQLAEGDQFQINLIL